MSLLIIFLALCASGYAATKALISYAHKYQLLDIANHRSSHTKATPRIGGLSFVVLISLSLLIYGLLAGKVHFVFFTLVPVLLVALTGLLDDIKGLSRSKRFMMYFVCSVIALGNFPSLFNHPYWLIALQGAILSISISWLINLFNFMDGIDGIAGSESIFIIAALAFFFYQGGNHGLCNLLLICTAPLMGFLLLNWEPAKIFMGDIGSTFLGCLIGCLSLYAINENVLNTYSAVILLACFIVDTSWTLAYRILTGQKWYHAHRSHHYQIMSRKLNSHRKVVVLYSLVNALWLLPMALVAHYWQEYGLLIATISLLPLVWRCFIIGAGKHEQN